MSRGLKKRRLTRSSAPPASHLFEKYRYSIDITLLIVPNSSPSPKITTAYPPHHPPHHYPPLPRPSSLAPHLLPNRRNRRPLPTFARPPHRARSRRAL